MDTAFKPPKEPAGPLKYAPPWARERSQAPLIKDEPPMERPLRSYDDTAGPTFRRDFTANLRRQVSLDPELVPEPKCVKEHSAAAIALRLTGVTVIAALIAWIVVSLPAMRGFVLVSRADCSSAPASAASDAKDNAFGVSEA